MLELSWDRLSEGLRAAQLGAIHGVGAHFTIHRDQVAQVVLPTGVGKTLVLTAIPFLLRAERVLVVAPTRVLRDQLAKAFRTLKDLKAAKVVAEITEPSVATANRRVSSAGEWRDLAEADVVVGTVHSLSSGYGATPIPADVQFDVALFDEAHHLPASTWTTLLRELPSNGHVVATTATPFRRDRQRIPGRVAFNYPLSQAMADGVFAPVEFIAIEADPEDQDAVDEAIASAAAGLLASPAHSEARSQLLIRTDRVEHAQALEQTYTERHGVPVRMITEKTTSRQMDKILTELDADDSDIQGLVCVGALIEGFNRPLLKVAAYHAPHQSLAATLQFIGRIARVGSAAPAQLLAVRGSVSGEARDLYDEDRSWSALIPELVDAEIEQIEELRSFVDRVVSGGTSEIPVESLTPSRSARIYSLADDAVAPVLDAVVERLVGRQVIRSIYDSQLGLRCLVTRRVVRPRWIQSDALDAPEYECHLVCWVGSSNLLFVSTDHGGVNRLLLQRLGVETSARPLAEHQIATLLSRQEVDRYFSVGAHETAPARIANTTYEMAAGGHVDAGLDPIRARGQRLGHAMGRGSADGTFGLSVKKSKWWEPEPTRSLVDFVRWCQECAAALSGSAADALPGLPYAMSRPLEHFPDSVTLAAVVPGQLAGWRLVGQEIWSLLSVELVSERISEGEVRLAFVKEGEELWWGSVDASGRVATTSGIQSVMDTEGELHDLDIALTDEPPTIVFGDGTTVIGAGLAMPASPDLGTLPSGVLLPRDWSTTDIHAEFQNADPGKQTIFETVIAWLGGADFAAPFVLCDHDPGELADFIALRPDGPNRCRVDLVHCKALPRDATAPRAQIADIEEILQQSARSSRWNVPGPALWADLIARRQRQRTSVAVGEELALDSLLVDFESVSPVVEFTVHAVQPGVAAARVEPWTNGRTLIHSATNWIRQLGAEFVFHCSQ